MEFVWPETKSPVGLVFAADPAARPALLAIKPVLPAVVLSTVPMSTEVALRTPLKVKKVPLAVEKQLPEQTEVPPVNDPLVMDRASVRNPVRRPYRFDHREIAVDHPRI